MAFENLKSTGIKYVLTKLKDVFLQIKDAVKSVNDEEPDENGNIVINSVPYAQNLESESSHRNYDTFAQRTAGGDSSINNGNAWLMVVRGNSVHDGYSPESINMTVIPVERENPITATLNRDVFISYVAESATITLTYTSSWSEDPSLYGISIDGTPVSGDVITIVYVAEVRGTITVANPQSFIATGWNLFDSSKGYAKVVKYASGYRIDGTYTSIKYSATLTGTQSDIVVTDHNFDISADGYIFVTGGNSTDTAIYPVWEDWTEGSTEEFEPYSENVVDLSTIMSASFPYGLMKAGTALDEIDLNLEQAISRIERLTYTAENLATAESSGREFEYDENYIYLVRANPLVISISVDGGIVVNDHGIEYFTDTSVSVYAEILYGNNLKNKLERDVLTISSQTLTSTQKAKVQTNLDVPSNESTLHKAGDLLENVSGSKWFYNDINIGRNSRGKGVHFNVSNGQEGGTIKYDTGNYDKQSQNQFSFIEYSPNTTASATNTGFYEQYNLPTPNKGLSANASYDIYTEKNEPKIYDTTSSTTHSYTVPNNSCNLFAFYASSTAYWFGFLAATSAGVVSVVEIAKGSGISSVTTGTRTVTFTLGTASGAYARCFNIANGWISLAQ